MAIEPGYVSLMKKIPKNVSLVLAIVSAIVTLVGLVLVATGGTSVNLINTIMVGAVLTLAFVVAYVIAPKPQDSVGSPSEGEE